MITIYTSGQFFLNQKIIKQNIISTSIYLNTFEQKKNLYDTKKIKTFTIAFLGKRFCQIWQHF